MKIGTLGFALGLSAAISLPAAADTIVSPAHMGDWAFVNADANSTVGANATGNGQMVNGPAVPPAGNGSANISTGDGTSGGDGAEILANGAYQGTALSSITALSYSTYMTSNNGQQMPYLRLEVKYDSGTKYDQIFFEPPYQTPGSGSASLPDQGASTLDAWQNWDALAGGWWDNQGLCGGPGSNVVSFAACVAVLGDAEIVNDRGVAGALVGVGGIQFTVGFTSDTDVSNGNVDNFTIGINGDNVTYDFEAADASPAPEPFSIALFGAGLSGLAFSRRRRK